MTPADFLAAVNAVAGHSTNDFSHHSCPDQRVARLVNGDWTDPDRVNLPAEREPGQRVLHIVLESPHKHEYGPAPGFAPKGPAMNTTGKNIQKCLNLIPGLNPGDFDLYLINAIQYQCSLGRLGEPLYEKRRDLVWHECWHRHNGRVCFEDRLRRYYRSGDLVLVAATQTKLSKQLRHSYGFQDITKEGKKYVIDCSVATLPGRAHSVRHHRLWDNGVAHADFLTYHPSSWRAFVQFP